MKTFLVLVLSVAALFVWQRRGNDAPQPAPAQSAATESAAAPSPRVVWEHDWAKHSIDRTHEVLDQVRQTRDQNEDQR